MYESRFGITGPPFQLSPDPSFYFDSRGHHSALDQLRRGLADEARFIVVSGEIGAGKTTTVRMLVAELDPAVLAVAQVVSTQLDALELMQSVLLAFGLSERDGALAELQVNFHRFLVKLDREGRRAVLIVDEAQNLAHEAFDQLVALARWRLPRRMPLQVVLIGQPELREIIEAPAMRGLRQLIDVSCHLGPLHRSETGAYIEHRLRKVGWSGSPHFTDEAFEAIYQATGGIPRRINLLCNRLMLSRFLADETEVDAETVAQTAGDLEDEIGDPAELTPGSAAALAETRPVRPPVAVVRQAPAVERGALWCVVSSPADHIKAAPLMLALAARPELPAARLVRAHRNEALELSQPLFAELDLARALIELDLPERRHGPQGDGLREAFAAALGEARPSAVVLFDDSAVALACATAARALGLQIVHVGAGLRVVPAAGGAAVDDPRPRIEALANMLYTPDLEASQTLRLEQDTWERSLCAGSLLVDAAHLGLRMLAGQPASGQAGQAAYGLVVLSHPVNLGDRQTLIALLSIVADVSRDIALRWPMHVRVQEQLKKFRLEPFIAGVRVECTPARPYPQYIGLLRDATCVLTDSWSVQEEATALGIPCITVGLHPERAITSQIGSNLAVGIQRNEATRAVWNCLFNGGRRGRVPELWDGKAATRIVAHLGGWLPAAIEEAAETTGSRVPESRAGRTPT